MTIYLRYGFMDDGMMIMIMNMIMMLMMMMMMMMMMMSMRRNDNLPQVRIHGGYMMA